MLLIYSAIATVIFPKSGNAVYADPSFTMANKSWAAMQQCQPRSICQKISLINSFLIKITFFSDRWQAADKQTKSVNFFSFAPSVQNKQSIQERKQSWYLWWYWISTGSGCDKGLGSPQKSRVKRKNVKCCLMWEKITFDALFKASIVFFRAVCQLPSNQLVSQAIWQDCQAL